MTVLSELHHSAHQQLHTDGPARKQLLGSSSLHCGRQVLGRTLPHQDVAVPADKRTMSGAEGKGGPEAQASVRAWSLSLLWEEGMSSCGGFNPL